MTDIALTTADERESYASGECRHSRLQTNLVGTTLDRARCCAPDLSRVLEPFSSLKTGGLVIRTDISQRHGGFDNDVVHAE